LGETSTRSRPNSAAVSSACLVGIMPIWLPSGSITLISLALIFLFILTLFVRIGRWGRLGEAMFYLLVSRFVIWLYADA
jgi:hypothetical protein